MTQEILVSGKDCVCLLVFIWLLLLHTYKTTIKLLITLFCPQSIIFIRHFTKGGFEISGYIDYAHRLVSENWTPFFRSSKMLWPRDNDLGYYHWRHGTVRSNISRNYKVSDFWCAIYMLWSTYLTGLPVPYCLMSIPYIFALFY